MADYRKTMAADFSWKLVCYQSTSLFQCACARLHLSLSPSMASSQQEFVPYSPFTLTDHKLCRVASQNL